MEREGRAWVSWQQELEALRVFDARQRQIVGMAELAASVEREQDMLSNEEQWWSEEQIEGQEAEQRARTQQEKVLPSWRIGVGGVDDSALQAEMIEVRRAQAVAARAQRELALCTSPGVLYARFCTWGTW